MAINVIEICILGILHIFACYTRYIYFLHFSVILNHIFYRTCSVYIFVSSKFTTEMYKNLRSIYYLNSLINERKDKNLKGYLLKLKSIEIDSH